MRSDGRPTVRELVKKAVEALEGDTTNVAIGDWILQQYPGTNKSTIQCDIIPCTVNHASRIHYAYNRKPRALRTRLVVEPQAVVTVQFCLTPARQG